MPDTKKMQHHTMPHDEEKMDAIKKDQKMKQDQKDNAQKNTGQATQQSNQEKKDDTAAGSEREQAVPTHDYSAVKTRTSHVKSGITGSDDDGQS